MTRLIFLISGLFFAIPVFAYIDPSAGFPFFAWGPLLLAFLAGLLSGLLFTFKKIIKFFYRNYWIILLILLLVILLIIITHMQSNRTFPKKIIIIGMDGLDYNLTKRFMKEGYLPHFQELKKEGLFLPLRTVLPAESNVAWISFATAKTPGNHGVFDFIMRQPENYTPQLALGDISSEQDNIKIGPLRIPFKRVKVKKVWKEKTFWEITSQHKIPTYIYFAPLSFPPDKVYGRLISGMGVPDIRGTMGTFSFYTTKPLDKKKYVGGLVFQVKKTNNIINTFLYGPRNTTLNPPQDVKIPFKVEINHEQDSIVIHLGRERIVLKKGEWSPWVRVVFKVNALNKVRGILRFYLKSVKPEFELYVSPINFNPQSPLFPISYPLEFSKKLSQEVGLFYTQGMPYDTWPLNERRIDYDIFLSQANFVLEERERILRKELSEFKGGLFFFYLGYTDPIQHMFWSFMNRENSSYKDIVLSAYKKMDRLLGWVKEQVDEDTIIIVLSDHGFGPFKRAVHLNSWLRDNGFLALREDNKTSKEFFANVDWKNTKAYALGFGGIYINQIGREAEGIVSDGEEKERLVQEIKERLSQWRDPESGELVVHHIYTKEEAFRGKYEMDAPDLFVGFNKGYRASWQTALGKVPVETLEDNLKPWHADHIFDPSLVQGVLLVNSKLSFKPNPNIVDIIPQVLKELGIKEGDRDSE